MTTEAHPGPEGSERLRIAPVCAESLRTLFQQVSNSLAAETVVTVYMVATAWPFHSWRRIGL